MLNTKYIRKQKLMQQLRMRATFWKIAEVDCDTKRFFKFLR